MLPGALQQDNFNHKNKIIKRSKIRSIKYDHKTIKIHVQVKRWIYNQSNTFTKSHQKYIDPEKFSYDTQTEKLEKKNQN